MRLIKAEKPQRWSEIAEQTVNCHQKIIIVNFWSNCHCHLAEERSVLQCSKLFWWCVEMMAFLLLNIIIVPITPCMVHFYVLNYLLKWWCYDMMRFWAKCHSGGKMGGWRWWCVCLWGSRQKGIKRQPTNHSECQPLQLRDPAFKAICPFSMG